MKLKRLTLKNFRCFDELDIELHDQLTVLIAPNGAGKTTLLDAARIALSSFIKGIDVSSARPHVLASITPDDVRLKKMPSGSMEPQKPTEIIADGILGTDKEDRTTWKSWRESVETKTRMFRCATAEHLTRFATDLQAKSQNSATSDNTELPLILYQGTGRLWYQGRFTAKVDDKELQQQTYSRIWGYENCLTATSGYKQFEDWFGWLYKSYQELQIAMLENPNHHNQQELDFFKEWVNAVQAAVNEVTESVTGWKNLQYRQSQGQKLVMEHDECGFMPLDMLSDGLRNIVILVADIAFRCVRLNPQYGRKAAMKTHGVVLIDEVDMFLHPAWQQQVISSLQRAFENLQFIVTTHSPQVISTVDSKCIRILENGKVHPAPAGSKGAESTRILKRLFKVDPRPILEDNAQMLREYEQMVYDDNWDSIEAAELRAKLNEAFAGEEPKLTELDEHIANRKWERGLEKDS